jgi:hypothetical protein
VIPWWQDGIWWIAPNGSLTFTVPVRVTITLTTGTSA